MTIILTLTILVNDAKYDTETRVWLMPWGPYRTIIVCRYRWSEL